MKDSAVVVLVMRGVDAEHPEQSVPENYTSQIDIEVPLYISANDLVSALNEKFRLGIEPGNITECYFTAEDPVALIRGNRTLDVLGIRNGTIIHADRRR